MINWLQKYGGYTSNGLTLDEKTELERLRSEIKKYRDLEAENNTQDDTGSQKSNNTVKTIFNFIYLLKIIFILQNLTKNIYRTMKMMKSLIKSFKSILRKLKLDYLYLELL
jgi:hypothetical protein